MTRKNHRDGHFSATFVIMTHHTAFFHDAMEGLRHLVVAAHQGGTNLGQAELQPCVVQGALKRDAFVGVGGVVVVVLRLYGHQRTDGVVRRLHEIGGFQQLFAFVGEGVEEELRVLDAAESRSRHDGVDGVATCGFQGFFRGGQGTFQDATHTARLDG